MKQLNASTYEFALSGGDKVEVGDLESIGFKPSIKLNRWDGECFIKVSLPTTEKITPVIEGNKTRWIDRDIEVDFYPLESTTVIAKDKDGKDVEFTQNELGGFEFEVILKKKPKTNKIVLDIETQELKFYYQPELTPEEIAEGCVRPDNVVGSYAVYHATRRDHIIGQTNYMVGIAFHIYRPEITDAEGKQVWGELSLDEKAGTLTTTIPQDFLDAAVYPVSTGQLRFGYETIGGSSVNVSIDDLNGALFTSPANATTAISITMYHGSSDVINLKGVIVLHGTLEILDNGVGDPVTTDGTLDWFTSTFPTSPALSGSTEYVLMGISDLGFWAARYNAGETNQRHVDFSNNYTTPTDPTDAVHENTVYSIYCTYEEEVGGVNYERLSSVIVGVVSTSSRTLAFDRDSLVIVGDLVTASRIYGVIKSASVLIGNVVTASRLANLSRSALVLVGNLVTASWGTAITRTSSVIVGTLVTASRAISITRTSSLIIGIVVSASKSLGRTRTSSVIVGIVASSSRALTFTRQATTIIGNLVTASRVVAYARYASRKMLRWD